MKEFVKKAALGFVNKSMEANFVGADAMAKNQYQQKKKCYVDHEYFETIIYYLD